MADGDFSRQILPILPARVWRTYTGGLELEKWHGVENPGDSELPEDWVASTVRARNPKRDGASVDEGLSKVKSAFEVEITLKDLITADPIGMLGTKHVFKYGNDTCILVKMIDSLHRLTIQVHPDRCFSRDVLGSAFGKTEAWYIIGGRSVDGAPPHVYLGFKPGITRALWEDLFQKQEIETMLSWMHKIMVRPGEVFFIKGGVPHAIGSGCFLLELQEPTDYTFRVERITPDGKAIPDHLIHQGVGFAKIFDCFHYEGYALPETLARWRIPPRTIFYDDEATQTVLLDTEQTRLFGMRRLSLTGACETNPENAFTIAVVLVGRGRVSYDNGSLAINQGDFLFLPAEVGNVRWQAVCDSGLELIMCYPPA